MNYRVEVTISDRGTLPNAEFFWLHDARKYKDDLIEEYKKEGSNFITVVLRDIKTGKEME